MRRLRRVQMIGLLALASNPARQVAEFVEIR